MDPVFKDKQGNLFKKEDVEDERYVLEAPDKDRIFITQDQLLPEKADKNSSMEAVKVIFLEKTSQELTKARAG
ncbi:hypothetical protein DAPPUDRAFT_336824 [Daphnia pulex]|uniref:Uncharacterized protein n=1 Tax=Daphnia pulex TaxID=6669 RepID=E9I0F2_DAPPU|nr:hypothetical protein DAPPUDRAFT_336824 [Daphnia pulex]|eukprot:EFX62529.1 hypothetical protein DAPPUDRAFT_336824 [Daphnia pulex]